MAAAETRQAERIRIEPGRGVYDTARAAALSGVPASTLHYWVRTQLYLPSISSEGHTRLWSWADLIALRAIDWFRKGDNTRVPIATTSIRRSLDLLEHVGYARADLHRIMAVAEGGRLFLELPGQIVRAEPGMQSALPEMIRLVGPYRGAPDLLEPRPLLRIIPGKLHGEPHIVDTRIPSLTINELHRNGYDLDQIHAMYPDASLAALREAIAFEQSLITPHAA